MPTPAVFQLRVPEILVGMVAAMSDLAHILIAPANLDILDSTVSTVSWLTCADQCSSSTLTEVHLFVPCISEQST